MRTASLALLLLVLFTPSALAQQPVILAAIPDVAKGHLWIVGDKFGPTPVVTIGGLVATVFHAGSDAIGTIVPPGVLSQPGSYELTVASSHAAVASFNVTIPSKWTMKPMMVDATGRIIGPMVEAPFVNDPVSARVLVTGNGLMAVVQVSRDAFRGQEPAAFESEDCTGPPFLKPIFLPGEQIVPSTTTLTADGYLYAVDDTLAPSRPALRSMWRFGFDSCEPYVGPFGLHSPTRRVLDLTQFTPPFRLVLQ
jgi:hypothetical protein